MSHIWYIYHIKNCRYAKPDPKNKYVAIVCKALDLWGFFINTDIRPFIQKQPDLLACQILIKATDYKCLNHDSYIDCTQLYPFEDNELLDIKEPINQQTKEMIKQAVAISKTLIPRHQKIILAN